MTKTDLRKMTKKDLLALAKKKRISVSASMLKAEIVDTIFGALSKGTGKTRTGRSKKTAARPRTTAGRKAGAKAEAVTRRKGGRKTGSRTTAEAKSRKTLSRAKSKTGAGAKASAKPKAGVKPGPGRKTRAKRVGTAGGRPAAPGRSWNNGRTIRQKAVAGKFELTAGPVSMPPVESMEIPADYGVTRIVAMVRDPRWLFAYWEITAERFSKLEKKFGDEWTRCTMALRVDDLDSKEYFDIDISYEARAWYINVAPGGRYRVAIGVLTPGGKFVRIAESAVVETPRGRVSDRVDEEWVVPEDVYDRIFAASGGYDVSIGGGSAEMRAAAEAGIEEEISSGAVSSFGSGEMPPGRGERGFRLRVATELILYGATEPDARVTIQGKPVKLRRDGTFTARFALPDGTIEIPVTAVSADGVEERSIETDVRKRSKEKEPVVR